MFLVIHLSLGLVILAPLRYRFFFMACEIVFCWNAVFITTNVVPSMKLIMSLVF